MKNILTAFIFIFLLTALPAAAQKPVKTGVRIVKKMQANSAPKIKSAPIPLTTKPNKSVSAAAEKAAQKIRAKRPALFSKKDGHVFMAVVEADPDTRFSGTVFEIEYNGKKEIYGAIATHTIPAEENDPFGLFKHFTVIIHRPGQPPLKTKAEVVAFSPVSMLDIACEIIKGEFRLTSCSSNRISSR